MADRVAPPAQRLRGRARRMPFNGWLADLVVGILAGSVLVGGIGESVLVTARVEGSAVVAVTLIVTGSIVGVAFMRLVRARAAADDARHREG